MRTDVMIAQLRRTAEKHKNDKLYTFDTNITQMCLDVSARLEELNEVKNKVIQLNENIENLIDAAHDAYMSCDDEMEKAMIDGQIKAYWQTKNFLEEIIKLQ